MDEDNPNIIVPSMLPRGVVMIKGPRYQLKFENGLPISKCTRKATRLLVLFKDGTKKWVDASFYDKLDQNKIQDV